MSGDLAFPRDLLVGDSVDDGYWGDSMGTAAVGGR